MQNPCSVTSTTTIYSPGESIEQPPRCFLKEDTEQDKGGSHVQRINETIPTTMPGDWCYDRKRDEERC